MKSPLIAYFAHDLSDPAIYRRMRMLSYGGATVAPIGFRRSSKPITALLDLPAIDLGRTLDGRLLQRALSVIKALARLEVTAERVLGADVILARNIEMLAIAASARRRYAPTARLVYECLDIHRMLTSKHADGKLLRLFELFLWRDVDLLLTSSPAFVRHYFVPRGFPAPIKVIENKVLMPEDGHLGANGASRPVGPPWRIGWFGMIRCRKSLEILSSVAQEARGAVEVIIRGRPSDGPFSDFDAAVAGRPFIRYLGPYYNSVDLAKIYSEVHFAWAVDYYETGQNSAWLLPNRIYESTAHGAVPIGLSGVETGCWLTTHAVGVVLREPLQEQLVDFFKTLDRTGYANLARAVDTLPRTNLVSDRTECRALVKALSRLPFNMPSSATARASRVLTVTQNQTASGCDNDGIARKSLRSL